MFDVLNSQPKPLADLTQQWDQLAKERARQLSSGLDISFSKVVAPTALRLLQGADLSALLDIGSGTGHFATLVSPLAGSVIGVEPSGASVEIAMHLCESRTNVRFIQAAVEDVTVTQLNGLASAATAVMVMMAAPDLGRFAAAVNALLRSNSTFVAVIPHPCFWPEYWGYANAEWYDYTKETFVEAPFKVSRDQTSIRTTHIHRPLSQYLSTFAKHGFKLVAFEEPIPEESVQAMYPEPWHFPRFAALKWIKE
ncbi:MULTISPECIES: class I SAM-dependent methyltransferase [unclassified Pseudomonas]|uniref:methyltransferase domain-containing protein n=1 Tax=unclassified Pseudomonas TaxID=196821 RepID=UPI001F24D6C6|nr:MULTISPECIES: class I SAM-dependent methyltransferase [unclassified Pseudomonas]MCF5232368.1 methyltransferase domain-containing protein [Pseudomonas sp. PA-5-4H]MCF5238918.1 methyltransferase domain-containing protein [Pseudomonas sp. PA-5-4G]MCF5250260.1 methyltransferase domain-containing protein [Pseudomonas sp. PA-5-4B]MCF5252933.1 methyltransferase domain-containing protein [Pseudomonas sp. PA-5-4B]MCF5260406.1 methyltransferase domain-containing protein [Pseudomonas sp. PA-5-4A]